MTADVQVQFDVPARMRDGVTLRANIFRPAGADPRPILLWRHPYGKDAPGETAWCGFDPVQTARRGFIVVIQDTRGRFASDGEWRPFRFEGTDGHDSIEWAARLPGSNGRVGMLGGSYHGNTQWLAALERPPSLRAISPMMTWSDPLDGLFARGGAVELGLAVVWTMITGLGHLDRLGLDPGETKRRTDAAIEDWDRLDADGYWGLPVGEAAVLQRHGFPRLGGAEMPADAGTIESCRVAGLHGRVGVPSLNTAGWHDLFLQGTLDNFRAMAEIGADARLVVGPWAHEVFADPIGDRVFGLRSGRDGAPAHREGDWNDLQLAWLGRRLQAASGGEPEEAPVRIFVMGRNRWRDEDTWPPRRARPERWYMQGDGRLAPGEPGHPVSSSEFVYDPEDPVPTTGGSLSMSPGHRPGPVEQAEVEQRNDVLIFTSSPLDRELEVTGRLHVVLCAQSSAPSTDWVARLCDVNPDGRSYNVADGILRVNGDAQRRQHHVIDLWSTSIVFPPGHRLRVQLTSSCFPRWDRNLNTGDQGGTRSQIARQKVHLGAGAGSYIELPVIRT